MRLRNLAALTLLIALGCAHQESAKFGALPGTGSFNGSSGGATVSDGSITNAKLANVPTATFKGRTTAGTGVPQDLTATQATAMLNAATTSLPGAMTAAQVTKLAGLLRRKQGADLVDNTVTISPATDKASQYDLPLATPLTANREVTLDNSGSPFNGQMCLIRVFDTSAFTYIVRNNATTALYTFTASAAAGSIREAWFYFNGTNWAFFPAFFYLQSN